MLGLHPLPPLQDPSPTPTVNNEDQRTWGPAAPGNFFGLCGLGHRSPPLPIANNKQSDTEALCQPPPPIAGQW